MVRKPARGKVASGSVKRKVLSSGRHRLSPEELGLLAHQLAEASDPATAARLKERLTRGFYGI